MIQLSLSGLEDKCAISFVLLEIKTSKAARQVPEENMGCFACCVESVMVLVNANRMSTFATDKLSLFFFCLVADVEILIPVSSPSLSTSWHTLLKCLS